METIEISQVIVHGVSEHGQLFQVYKMLYFHEFVIYVIKILSFVIDFNL